MTKPAMSMERLKSLLSVEPKDAIIYGLPGYTPDCRLIVLGYEFHVHSILLKLHSAFFRKFLDSPEKEDRFTGTEFKYEWVTQVDNDCKSWCLVSADSDKGPSNEANWLNDEDKRENLVAFGRLLQAIYGRTYEFFTYGYKELEFLVTIADYYCALPVVSRTLGSTLIEIDSEDLLYEISISTAEMLPISAKLRHAALFRDCMNYLCSSWEDPRFESSLEEHPKLKELVRSHYNKITYHVAKAYDEIRDWETRIFNRIKAEYHPDEVKSGSVVRWENKLDKAER